MHYYITLWKRILLEYDNREHRSNMKFFFSDTEE